MSKRWPQVAHGPKANISPIRRSYAPALVILDERAYFNMTPDEYRFEEAVTECGGHPVKLASWHQISAFPKRRADFMKYAEARANSRNSEKAEPWKKLWAVYLAKKLCE
jgi:hypothetical protein